MDPESDLPLPSMADAGLSSERLGWMKEAMDMVIVFAPSIAARLNHRVRQKRLWRLRKCPWAAFS